MENKKNQIWFLIILAVLVLAIIAVLIVWLVGRNHAEPELVPEPVPTISEPDVIVEYREKEKLVEVEKIISAKIIQDKLKDMGFMVTQEYLFTDVMNYSSVKDLFGMELPFTESYVVASYDGTVTAGVDFSRILVFKDETAKTVTVTMPEAKVLNTTIDNDSLKVYSEKEGLGNNISISDYNTSVITLKKSAEEKAIERGLLDKASENAKQMIGDFISSLVDTEEEKYTITFQTK